MKRAILCGGRAGAVLPVGRGESARLTPKNAKGPLPFPIARTPYGVPGKEATEQGLAAGQRWRSENYIFVAQNLRGRFRSEGKFAMYRPHDATVPYRPWPGSSAGRADVGDGE